MISENMRLIKTGKAWSDNFSSSTQTASGHRLNGSGRSCSTNTLACTVLWVSCCRKGPSTSGFCRKEVFQPSCLQIRFQVRSLSLSRQGNSQSPFQKSCSVRWRMEPLPVFPHYYIMVVPFTALGSFFPHRKRSLHFLLPGITDTGQGQ